MSDDALPTIDMHVHVGLLGDRHPQWGRISSWYRQQLVYRVFLLYAGVEPEEVNDRTLRAATERVIDTCSLDRVVCLALDPVFDREGRRCEDDSHFWVDNEYILELRKTFPDKVLLGASVHPYDPEFGKRLTHCVDQGAVLLKWLPSAQQIDLADPRVGKALLRLATAGSGGRPLPLLLHVGPEYAIPSSDPRTQSYDYLSWSWWDALRNRLRGKNRWHTPDLEALRRHLRAALDAGAVIIFAHCGLPYFTSGLVQRVTEHSDFDVVKAYLEGNAERAAGRCYADLSACVTPLRQRYYPKIKRLPADSLLLGSDFPVPVFELSAGRRDALGDFKAVLDGRWDRILVPEDNLLDVNRRELFAAFPGHPLFTNFARLLPK